MPPAESWPGIFSGQSAGGAKRPWRTFNGFSAEWARGFAWPEAVGLFRAVSQAAGGGEDLPRVWRERAETLTLEPWDRSAISDLGGDLQGDEEKVCKAISHVAYELAKSAEETERKRPEREKQAMALWFSSAALLVILLV